MKSSPVIGWREWAGFPELGIPRIKAKIDTGARSSALHAFDVEIVEHGGLEHVRFVVHPMQRSTREPIRCQAPLLEYRKVRNSGGHVQERPVILAELRIGDDEWPIELTLTSRDAMGFRLLLGREAVRRRALVDPGRSYLVTKGVRTTRAPRGRVSRTAPEAPEGRRGRRASEGSEARESRRAGRSDSAGTPRR